MPVRKRNRTELTGKHATPEHPPRKAVSTPALRNAPRVPKAPVSDVAAPTKSKSKPKSTPARKRESR